MKRRLKSPKYQNFVFLVTRHCNTSAIVYILWKQASFFDRVEKSGHQIKKAKNLHKFNIPLAYVLYVQECLLRLPPNCTEEIWKRNYQRSFWICVWGKPGRKKIKSWKTLTWWLDPGVFEKLRFQNVFHPRYRVGVFKFISLKERFRKAPFSSWFGVDGKV